MTKDEALKLALEALEEYANVVVSVNDPNEWTPKVADAGEPARKAITAIKEALANDALERMAENARELGLDYEPSRMTIDASAPLVMVSHPAFQQSAPVPEAHEQEPWSRVSIGVDMTDKGAHVIGIYAMTDDTSQVFYAKHYPAQQRKPLTDEEISEIAVKSQDGISPHDDTLRFARAIEAALRSKNT